MVPVLQGRGDGSGRSCSGGVPDLVARDPNDAVLTAMPKLFASLSQISGIHYGFLHPLNLILPGQLMPGLLFL